ncbi:MAG: nucleotidyltransferase domain-containing protein [Prochlorococcaceae cyanobacterium]
MTQPIAAPSPLPPLLTEHLEPLRELCRRFGVERLEVFGSAAKGTFDPGTSDLDFIARFRDPQEPGYCDRFCSFADAAEALIGRPVDLLTERMIRNPYFREDVDAVRQVVVQL